MYVHTFNKFLYESHAILTALFKDPKVNEIFYAENFPTYIYK